MKIRAYLTGAFFVLCVFAETIAFVGQPCDFSDDWMTMDVNKNHPKQLQALINLDTTAVSTQNPFSFQVAFCGGSGLKPQRITASAHMPAHQHGMNYISSVSYLDQSNRYEISGFLFHMPGLWEITISTYLNDAPTHFTKQITIK